MIDFTISCSSLEDAMTLDQWGLVDAHIEWAQKAIELGGRVVFERRYINKSPDTVMVISSEQELKDWKRRVAKAIDALKNIDK